ncbi:MAG: hypothetical protein K8J08_13100 [Thermoanaerobaculia bacterium]|nr:hypothetical protein [Thermoanaerobaculia bacterium]
MRSQRVPVGVRPPLLVLTMLLLIPWVTLAVGQGEAGEEAPPSVLESLKKTYRSYTRLTSTPRPLSAWADTLCFAPTELLEEDEARNGPHSLTSIHLYVNARAEGGLDGDPRRFPVGAVLIKEKFSGRVVKGVGGMEKMAEGYDPEFGDWRYFYAEDRIGLTEGPIASCRSCHERQRDRDFVYYRSGEFSVD